MEEVRGICLLLVTIGPGLFVEGLFRPAFGGSKKRCYGSLSKLQVSVMVPIWSPISQYAHGGVEEGASQTQNKQSKCTILMACNL
jgi:hypothetical protein